MVSFIHSIASHWQQWFHILIPCSDQYLLVHANHCIEHHLGAMNKPYDEYPLVYVNGDIYLLYHFSDQHLLMFITEMSTHCLIQWRSSFPITMQWSASGDVYHCNEHPLLNNGDYSIFFFFLTVLPCSDQHLVMFITVMSTHCYIQWRVLFSFYHAMMLIIVMSTIQRKTLGWEPIVNTMEIDSVNHALINILLNVYQCNEHHPEVSIVCYLYYLILLI